MKCSIIGIGKLGLCMALSMERVGIQVCGCDVSEKYIKSLNDKTFFSYEPLVNEYLKESRKFKATTSIKDALEFSNNIFIAVATPSLENGEFDHSYINGVLEQIKSVGDIGEYKMKHIVIVCTVMPGYTDSIREEMQKYNYTVSYNPEFIAQGNIIYGQYNPDMVLIGSANSNAIEMLEEVYDIWLGEKRKKNIMLPKEAEICKLALNCFITTKIAFANSIGDLAVASGCSPQVILDAIADDSRIGNKCMKYGFGYGGPCFPRDGTALRKYGDSVLCNLHISYGTDMENKEHLKRQVYRTKIDYAPGSTITIKGVAYKDGTVILEKSQKVEYAIQLVKEGFKVKIEDHKEVIRQLRELYGDMFEYEESRR